MPKYTIKNVTTEAATLDEARRLATAAYLRHIAGIDAPEPTEQEIDALLAELEAEKTERLDLADLGRQVAAELAWLDTTVSSIDDYAAAQVRDVVKRLAQENRAILRALRFVVGGWRKKRPAWGGPGGIVALIEPILDHHKTGPALRRPAHHQESTQN